MFMHTWWQPCWIVATATEVRLFWSSPAAAKVPEATETAAAGIESKEEHHCIRRSWYEILWLWEVGERSGGGHSCCFPQDATLGCCPCQKLPLNIEHFYYLLIIITIYFEVELCGWKTHSTAPSTEGTNTFPLTTTSVWSIRFKSHDANVHWWNIYNWHQPTA